MDLHRSRPTGRHLRTHDPENGQRRRPPPLLVGHRLDKEGTTSELSRGTSDLESRDDVADMARQVSFSGESSEARLRRNRRRRRTRQRRRGLPRRADRQARSPPRRRPRTKRPSGRSGLPQRQGLLDVLPSALPRPRPIGSRRSSSSLTPDGQRGRWPGATDSKSSSGRERAVRQWQRHGQRSPHPSAAAGPAHAIQRLRHHHHRLGGVIRWERHLCRVFRSRGGGRVGLSVVERVGSGGDLSWGGGRPVGS